MNYTDPLDALAREYSSRYVNGPSEYGVEDAIRDAIRADRAGRAAEVVPDSRYRPLVLAAKRFLGYYDGLTEDPLAEEHAIIERLRFALELLEDPQ